ncbi:MAG: hypothetical protein CVU06_14300 [Bacteroidetes bacterium HGW-Bacteroidetes-22]|nr:MAG: hypothetical protein CVU06_14300 [Bacteroidetes bacterium HGW-Bacteroidetes-22]
MQKNLVAVLVFLMVFCYQNISAQDDLMDVFGDEPQGTEYAYGTFKTTRVVLNHSIQNPAPGDLLFIISHHFGHLNEGPYNLFGLDMATIRFGLEYGITNRLSLGIGRGTYKKIFDGHVKYKILQQSSGERNMPFSISYFASAGINTLKWQDLNRTNYFTSRLTYVHQLLIARKFNNWLSLQLTPTIVHRNLVATTDDQNTVYVMGAGGRLKLSQRVSLNAEYFYILPGKTADDFDNSLSIGLDIETGGHVFQLFFTNSNPISEHGFITETKGNWLNGDIYFGFNITRTFTLK